MKQLLCLLAFVACFAGASAQKVEQGTVSSYSQGAFHTTAVYLVNTPPERLEAILDEIFNGLQDKPTKNLRWLWKNLGHHDNVENDVVLSEKGSYFNPENNDYLLKLCLAMKKGDKPMVFDVEGKLTKGRNGRRKNVLLRVTKKIKILDKANFSLTSIPQPGGKACVELKTDLDFGWFFSMFFTESRYRSLMEWRLQGLAMNIKKRAEGDTSPNY